MNEYENHNPDVLSCLASLSNDEVFTPPHIANEMLDLLPKELWSNPDVKILDPCCKSGIFLREAAKRFINGLKDVYPNLQERINHICMEQLYGIAITELTALMSRRSLYCSKTANGEYSICDGDFSECGNILFEPCRHTWFGNNCKFCGANKDNYDRPQDLEAHAYQFIHILKPEEIFNMRFDVIIGNPPYQLETGGSGRQAKPIYNLFVDQAKKLNPRHLVMIIPSRWFAGGMGLDKFRDSMLSDHHISKLVDYTNAKDCFPSSSVSGGVCYFHWDKDYDGCCDLVNIRNGTVTESIRPLDEFDVLIRYNEAIDIVRKVISKSEGNLMSISSSLTPFGLPTNCRGHPNRFTEDLALHSSEGLSYISPKEVVKGFDLIDSYKVLVSKTGAEHAGEPDKEGMYRVLTTSMKVIGPKEVCTHSYFTVGNYSEESNAINLLNYLKTKFVRFLILQTMTSINVSKSVMKFVPLLDFSRQWTDSDLYQHFELSQDQINFIESMIKSFGKGDDGER